MATSGVDHPTSLLWSHQLKREHAFLLERLKAMEAAHSAPTRSPVLPKNLQTQLGSLEQHIKEMQEDFRTLRSQHVTTQEKNDIEFQGHGKLGKDITDANSTVEKLAEKLSSLEAKLICLTATTHNHFEVVNGHSSQLLELENSVDSNTGIHDELHSRLVSLQKIIHELNESIVKTTTRSEICCQSTRQQPEQNANITAHPPAHSLSTEFVSSNLGSTMFHEQSSIPPTPGNQPEIPREDAEDAITNATPHVCAAIPSSKAFQEAEHVTTRSIEPQIELSEQPSDHVPSCPRSTKKRTSTKKTKGNKAAKKVAPATDFTSEAVATEQPTKATETQNLASGDVPATEANEAAGVPGSEQSKDDDDMPIAISSQIPTKTKAKKNPRRIHMSPKRTRSRTKAEATTNQQSGETESSNKAEVAMKLRPANTKVGSNNEQSSSAFPLQSKRGAFASHMEVMASKRQKVDSANPTPLSEYEENSPTDVIRAVAQRNLPTTFGENKDLENTAGNVDSPAAVHDEGETSQKPTAAPKTRQRKASKRKR